MTVVIALPEQVMGAVFTYLQSRPYNEVNQLVAAVNSQAQRVEVPDPTTKSSTDVKETKDVTTEGS